MCLPYFMIDIKSKRLLFYNNFLSLLQLDFEKPSSFLRRKSNEFEVETQFHLMLSFILSNIFSFSQREFCVDRNNFWRNYCRV